jgi:NADPH:quinone reductase-like Zn-dependent oxidoreductase
VDHILEVVGGDNVRRAIGALAKGGHLALIGIIQGFGAAFDIVPVLRKRAIVRGVLVGNRRHFEAVNRALETMRIRPVIDAVYPFSETLAAFAHLNRGPFGKVVIAIAEP